MTEPVEPISAEQARAALEAAIRQHLGDNWRDEDSGWDIVTQHDYMARLSRGRVNVDFYVDLLGNVEVKTSEISPVQDSGRLIVWSLLIVSIILALVIARIVGFI
jgi:hypothetical protein